MANRRIYNGVYKTSSTPCQRVHARNQDQDYRIFIRKVLKYLWTLYSAVTANSIAIVTFIFVIFAFFLPTLSNTHKNNELNEVKKVLNQMTEEVTRAEVACLTAAEDLCSLRFSISDEQTETSFLKREIYETCQFVQAVDYSRSDRSPFNLKRKSVSFAVSSPSIETTQGRKSQ